MGFERFRGKEGGERNRLSVHVYLHVGSCISKPDWVAVGVCVCVYAPLSVGNRKRELTLLNHV